MSPLPPPDPQPGSLHQGVSPATDRERRYWRSALRVTVLLLLVWFAVTFGISFFARDLDFRFFGWPFSFWVAGQGALLVYGLIIAFYAWYMNRLDERLVSEPTEDRQA